MNDEALMGIYKELKALRCLKQMELGMMVGKSNCKSLEELEALTDMIANPKKYFVKDSKSEEDKDD